MGMYADELGLDTDRMDRLIIFLDDRAEWHLRRETSLDIACAATARRDAGIIELLLGRISKARSYLILAGEQWTQLGLFSGYFLESIAKLELEFAARDVDAFSRLAGALEGDEIKYSEMYGRDQHPFEAASRNSPRQLINLYQATRGGRREGGYAAALGERISKRLNPNAAMSVGMTGLPAKTYLALFDRFGTNEATKRDSDILLSVVVRREELLSAAQSDQYHWRMMLKPAELVDMDLLVLGLNTLEAGSGFKKVIEPLYDRGTLATLPFRLAQDLHRPLSKPILDYL